MNYPSGKPPDRSYGWLAVLWVCASLGALGSCAPESPPDAPESSATPSAQTESNAPANVAENAAPTSVDQATEASPVALPGGLQPVETPLKEPGSPDEPGSATAYWGGSRAKIGAKSPWASIRRDRLHDPNSEAIGLLQEPRQAMRGLPRANSGNYVDWVKALDAGQIRPRARAGSRGAMKVLDLDVVLSDTKPMPTVTFSHRIHTEWLSCGNCHDWLFKKQAGATDITMKGIFRRRTCGLCHGKVAFPPNECFRCHNGPRPGATASAPQP